MEGFPCQMLSEGVTMRDDAAYSGVSSFGFGGTNAHAEAWGKNIFTSRGEVSSEPAQRFLKKLSNAPPPEITMNGEDVEDWETNGLDPRADPSTQWKVYLDDDGAVIWEKDDEVEDYGDEFFIQGTFNNWTPEPLDRHDVQGCWAGTITLDAQGEDSFQIVADNDLMKTYHPVVPYCMQKSVPIALGKADKDLCWTIKGQEGDIFKIEFFQQDKFQSIMWMKQS
jgi:hypothetical protein